MLTALIVIIGAYFIGSVNFAVIFTRAFTKCDVRDFGSGNAGTTNVMRVSGAVAGTLTFVCDALKGFLASGMGYLMFSYLQKSNPASWNDPLYGAYICGLACILGHVFPLFFSFKGGKGVATCVGVYAVCCPIAIICGLALFALMVFITRIVSLSSLTATVVVITLSLILYNSDSLFLPQAIMSIIIGLIVFLKHKDNIKRLLSGNEKKISVRR